MKVSLFVLVLVMGCSTDALKQEVQDTPSAFVPGTVPKNYISSNTSKKIEGPAGAKTIKGILIGKLMDFKNCYNDKILENPKGVDVTMFLNFNIQKNGETSEVIVDQVKNSNSALNSCIVDIVKETRFPEVKDSESVAVRQPLRFKSNVKKDS